jgi:flagellar M-ring protein FliF
VSRKTENFTYQTSRVVRHIKIPQGAVRRLSLAVLVDHKLRWEGEGPRARKVLEPPSPETLKIVRDVLAGVVGFQQDRGDQILVESLPFESTLLAEPPAARTPSGAAPARGGFTPPAWAKPWLDKAPLPVWLGAAAALLIVLAAIAWLILRRIFRRGPAATVDPAQAALAAGSAQAQLGAGDDSALEQQALAAIEHNRAEKERLEREALLALQKQLPAHTKKAEVLKKAIADQARKDPEAVAQLIRTWITENH